MLESKNVENVEKMMSVVTFTAHLSVTIKRLTRYQQKVVSAAMLEGKTIPSNMAANTNHTAKRTSISGHFRELPKCPRGICLIEVEKIAQCFVNDQHSTFTLYRDKVACCKRC